MRLVAYMSKKLNAAECSYTAHERELLALVHALTYWRPYLCGAHIKAYTDSTFLKYLKTYQLSSPRQVRWVSLIETFNVEFTHIPGVTNTAADALSRLDHLLMPILMPDPAEDWSSDYQRQSNGISGLSPWTQMTAEALITFHQWKYSHDDSILVPDFRVGEIITWCHDAMTAGHLGA